MKMESWILKRLISILSRAAKRPHVPRNAGMKQLLKDCGIEMGPSTDHVWINALVFHSTV